MRLKRVSVLTGEDQTISAASNGGSISRGFFKGAITGAFIGATFAVGGPLAAATSGAGVLGALTQRGNTGENIFNGGPLKSGGNFALAEIGNNLLSYAAGAFGLYSLARGNCSRSNSTDFARQSLCIGPEKD